MSPAEARAALPALGAQLDAQGWEYRQEYGLHPGWTVEKGLLRLAVYFRDRSDRRWVVRYKVGETPIAVVEGHDLALAMEDAQIAALRELRKLDETLLAMRADPEERR